MARPTALKRKCEALQAQREEEHSLLDILQSISDGGAKKVLSQLRSNRNVSSALQYAKSLEATELEFPQPPGLSDVGPSTIEDDGSSYQDLALNGHSFEPRTTYPDIAEFDPEAAWALPIEPYVSPHLTCCRTSSEIARCLLHHV